MTFILDPYRKDADPYRPYLLLEMGMDSLPAVDSSPYNRAVTHLNSGNTVLDTTVKRVGSSSVNMNESDPSFGLSSSWEATQDDIRSLGNTWTVECWCRPRIVPTTQPTSAPASDKRWDVWGIYTTGQGQDTFVSYRNDKRIWVNFAGAGGAVSTNTFEPGNWIHVAVSSNGSAANSIRLFVNGNLESTFGNGSSIHTGYAFQVGKSLVSGYPDWCSYWNGHLDDFKVYKGIAKYTSNFLPA